MQDWLLPGAVLGLCLLFAVMDWILAERRKGGMNVTDGRRIRGIVGIGFILAGVTYVIQSIA